MTDVNVAAAKARIEDNFARWARRNLSMLGKILIAKTYGISQIIYLMQSLVLKNVHIKVLNATLYKFIWNKNYHAAKAPERIKRTIVNTPIKLGGFGMLDISQLDEGLKVKPLGRLLDTNHPFLTLIKNRINMSHFFEPLCNVDIEPITNQALSCLTKYRDSLWKDIQLVTNKAFLLEISNSKISKLISPLGRISISFFLMHRNGKRLIKDLTAGDLNNLVQYIAVHKRPAITSARALRGGTIDSMNKSILVSGRPKKLSDCSSKTIRETFFRQEIITSYKIGLNLSKNEALNWADRVAKLSSVRHRNTILRVAHGDIYTNEKLFRFGLAASDKCDRCNEIDTLQHKFIDCQYVKEIWRHLGRLTRTLTPGNQNPVDNIKANLGAAADSSKVMITIHSEVLQRILGLRREQDYLLHPKKIIELSLKLIERRERSDSIKTEISSLLSKLN